MTNAILLRSGVNRKVHALFWSRVERGDSLGLGNFTTSKLEELMTDPDAWIKLLTALKDERSEKERLQAKVENDKSKVIFADSVSVAETVISVADLAKILKGNGIEIGQKRLFERLRHEGFLIRREGTDYNSPTQRSMELGLFKIKETAIARSDGRITISKCSKVTGRGQTYFVEYFLNRKKESQETENATNQRNYRRETP